MTPVPENATPRKTEAARANASHAHIGHANDGAPASQKITPSMPAPRTTSSAGYEMGGTLKSHAKSNKMRDRCASAAANTFGINVVMSESRPPSQRRRCESAVLAFTGASERIQVSG